MYPNRDVLTADDLMELRLALTATIKAATPNDWNDHPLWTLYDKLMGRNADYFLLSVGYWPVAGGEPAAGGEGDGI